jgi:hypothetical protein
MSRYIATDDSVTYELEIEGVPHIRVSILLREIRRERTGMHALVGIVEGGKVLAHDTFNIGRSEERRRLAKGGHDLMSRTTQELVEYRRLLHELDIVCLRVGTEWESSRVEITEIDTNDPIPGRHMLLFPHIERGTGTIVFGPPGAGKSYLMALMAVSLSSGLETLWGGPKQTPALYVDLERNETAFRRRLGQIRRSMSADVGRIQYLKGRGMGLASLKRKLTEWTREHRNGVLLYDSISRTGGGTGGSLANDDVANALIDLANSISDTWVALGHSPRADSGHLYGSVHFDAGADMVIKLSSEHRGSSLGCSLTVTKSNHSGAIPVHMYELQFDEGGLLRFKRSTQADWPELAPSIPELLASYLSHEDLSVTQLAAMVKLPWATISDHLKRDARFETRLKVGRDVLWSLKSKPV